MGVTPRSPKTEREEREGLTAVPWDHSPRRQRSFQKTPPAAHIHQAPLEDRQRRAARLKRKGLHQGCSPGHSSAVSKVRASAKPTALTLGRGRTSPLPQAWGPPARDRWASAVSARCSSVAVGILAQHRPPRGTALGPAEAAPPESCSDTALAEGVKAQEMRPGVPGERHKAEASLPPEPRLSPAAPPDMSLINSQFLPVLKHACPRQLAGQREPSKSSLVAERRGRESQASPADSSRQHQARGGQG